MKACLGLPFRLYPSSLTCFLDLVPVDVRLPVLDPDFCVSPFFEERLQLWRERGVDEPVEACRAHSQQHRTHRRRSRRHSLQ